VKKRSFRGGFDAKATAKRSTRSLVAVEVSARLTHVSAGKVRTHESRIGFELSFANAMTYTNRSAKYYQEINKTQYKNTFLSYGKGDMLSFLAEIVFCTFLPFCQVLGMRAITTLRYN
jgi:hypothetical protein